MMYVFNYRIPFLLCDVAKVGGELHEVHTLEPTCMVHGYKVF